MTILAYDSARPSLIPDNPPAILPYADGHFAWSHRLFPNARYRYITVTGNPDIDIADYELGCIFGRDNLRDWAERRLGRGHHDLTVYSDRNNVAEVILAMQGLEWHLILATLDGTRPTQYDGINLRGVQFTDRNNAYDVSAIYDEGWLIEP